MIYTNEDDRHPEEAIDRNAGNNPLVAEITLVLRDLPHVVVGARVDEMIGVLVVLLRRLGKDLCRRGHLGDQSRALKRGLSCDS